MLSITLRATSVFPLFSVLRISTNDPFALLLMSEFSFYLVTIKARNFSIERRLKLQFSISLAIFSEDVLIFKSIYLIDSQIVIDELFLIEGKIKKLG